MPSEKAAAPPSHGSDHRCREPESVRTVSDTKHSSDSCPGMHHNHYLGCDRGADEQGEKKERRQMLRSWIAEDRHASAVVRVPKRPLLIMSPRHVRGFPVVVDHLPIPKARGIGAEKGWAPKRHRDREAEKRCPETIARVDGERHDGRDYA